MFIKKKSLIIVLLLFFASIHTVDGLGPDKKAKSKWEKYHSKAQITNDLNKRIQIYEKFIKKCNNPLYVKIAQKKIAGIFFLQSSQTGTIKAYQTFIEKFPRSKKAKEAQMYIEEIKYHDICKHNTESEYERFLKDFPQGIYKKTLYRKISKLDFEKIAANPTVENWQRFIQKYPGSPLSVEARYRLDSQLLPRFREIQKRDNLEDYREFVQQYPESGFVHYCKERIARISNSQKKIKLKYRGYITPIKSLIISKLKNADFQTVYSGNDYDAICEVFVTRSSSGGIKTRVDDYGSYKIKTTTHIISTGGFHYKMHGNILLLGKGKVSTFYGEEIPILDGIAAGYLKGEKKYLKEALRSSNKKVVDWAAAHLSKIGNIHDADILLSVLPKVEIRYKDLAKNILERTKNPNAISPLFRRFRSNEYQDGNNIANFLYPVDETIISFLINSLEKSHSKNFRKLIIGILSGIKNPAVVDSIVSLLEKINDSKERDYLIRALGNHKTEKAIHALISLSENEKFRYKAGESLIKIGEPIVEKLIDSLQQENPDYQEWVIEVLGKLKTNHAVLPLMRLAEKGNPELLAPTLNALKEIGNPIAFDLVLKIFNKFKLKIFNFYKFSRYKNIRDRNSEKILGEAIGAIEKLGGPQSLDPLINLISTENYDEKIYFKAFSALSRIGDKRAVQPIMNSVEIFSALDLGDYREAAKAFKALKDEQTIPWLLKNLGAYRKLDSALVDAILSFGKKSVIPLSHLLMTTKYSKIADLVAKMLGQLKDSRAVEALLEKLESKDNIFYIIIALGEIGDPRAIGPLVQILKSTDYREVDLEKAIEALGKIKTDAVIGPLTDLLKDHRTRTRSAAISALGMTGNRAAIQPLRDMVKRATREEQEKIVRALANIRDKDVIDILIDMMDYSPNDVEIRLDRLTGESFGRDKKLWKQWWKQSRETFQFKQRHKVK